LNPFYKNLALWVVICLITVLLFNMFQRPTAQREKLAYSDFLAYVESGEVVSATIQGQNIHGLTDDGLSFVTYAPQDSELIPILRSKGVKISAKPADASPWYMTLLVSWFPMLLLIGIWIFFMRQMQFGGGKALSFGKSRAKLLSETAERITFEEVAGVEEAKEELAEVRARFVEAYGSYEHLLAVATSYYESPPLHLNLAEWVQKVGPFLQIVAFNQLITEALNQGRHYMA